MLKIHLIFHLTFETVILVTLEGNLARLNAPTSLDFSHRLTSYSCSYSCSTFFSPITTVCSLQFTISQLNFCSPVLTPSTRHTHFFFFFGLYQRSQIRCRKPLYVIESRQCNNLADAANNAFRKVFSDALHLNVPHSDSSQSCKVVVFNCSSSGSCSNCATGNFLQYYGQICK